MSEKMENILNLALDATTEERIRSPQLLSGFNPLTRTWDLIIRYIGDIGFLDQYQETTYVELYGGYATVTIPEYLIETLAREDQIIYIEKPKPLFFTVIVEKRISCINEPQITYNIYGEGVIVGIIDSGIDYSHRVFRNQDGTTRILELWDQSVDVGSPPIGYNQGTVFSREEINEALDAGSEREMFEIVPSRDLSGHGTHVAGIAAGNFALNRRLNSGIATRSNLIVVKLGYLGENSFPRTIELMQAIDYVTRRANFYNMPLALNLSFGNSYGSHDGTSLLETYIDTIANRERLSIAIGSGNEGSAGGHTSGTLTQNGGTVSVDIAVSDHEYSLNVQLWKSYADIFDIEVIAPSGGRTGILYEQNQAMRYRFAGSETKLLVYYGSPRPYSPYQEIYMDFVPLNTFVEPGIWTINLTPVKISSGRYDLWLPTAGALGASTRFLNPNPDTTITIPGTALKAITVGAYDGATDRYAEFSGRGFTRETRQVKPDIVAPGVNIESAAPGGGLAVMSGTSMATPFVTGSLALMLEWGIIQGRDPYLYGEKAKAYLIRGAKPLQGFTEYPNPQVGWGALCLRDSIPR